MIGTASRRRWPTAGCRVLTPWLRGYGPTRFLDPATPRSGQQAALGVDLRDFMDALGIGQAILGGYDWGGRAACVVAALWPERARGLVSITGYNIQNIPASGQPASAVTELRYWYQWYFQTERGRAGLRANRRDLARLLWRLWSPNWKFDDATFAQTAASFDNEDFVDVTIQSYRHRFANAPGDPILEELETRLAAQPNIAVPTIVLHGEADGVTPPDGSERRRAPFHRALRAAADSRGRAFPVARNPGAGGAGGSRPAGLIRPFTASREPANWPDCAREIAGKTRTITVACNDSSRGTNAMSDQFTEVTTQGWLQRIGGGFVAALIGLILVPVSIVVLYWNEGRAVDAIRALNRGAAAIVEVNATAVDPQANGKLVHVSGMMQPTTPARDPVFGVTGDGLLRLSRTVAMYQWKEEIQVAVHAVGRRVEDHRDHLHLHARLVGPADRLGAVQGARRPPEPADAGAVGDVQRRRGQARRLSGRPDHC